MFAPLLAQAAAVVVWATTFVLSADVLDSTSPAALTLLRFLLAAGLLLPFAMRRGGVLRALQSRTTALLGFTGVAAYYGLQNLGLLYTTAGTAALLQAGLPVATAALGVVLLQERLSASAIAGLMLASAGVALVAASVPELDIGAVLVVSGIVAYAVYTVVLRRLGDGVEADGSLRHASTPEPVVLATATALWGAAFLLPWQALELLSGSASLPSGTSAVLATAYLGLVGSGATLLLWTYGATQVPASVSGVLTAAIPALGYAMAVAAGEPASAVKTVGGILAIAGAVLASRAAVDRRVRQEILAQQGGPTGSMH